MKFQFPNIGRATPPKPAADPTPEQQLEGVFKGIADALNGINGRLDTLDKRTSQVAPARQAAPAQHEATGDHDLGINLDDLPDPVNQPDQFKKALGAKIGETVRKGVTTAVSQAEAISQNRTGRERKLDELWEKFQGAHPELAKFDDIVQVQVRKAVDEGKAAGIDPADLMFKDETAFMNRIAENTTERLKALGWKPVDPKAAPEGADAQDDEPGADDGRDLGFVFGGGAKPAGKAAAEAPSSFVAELQNAQRKSGLW